MVFKRKFVMHPKDNAAGTNDIAAGKNNIAAGTNDIVTGSSQNVSVPSDDARFPNRKEDKGPVKKTFAAGVYLPEGRFNLRAMSYELLSS